MSSTAIKLLRVARRLSNQVVKHASEVELWHKAVDDYLRENDPEDDPKERYDDPGNVKHRRYARQLYRDS